MDWFDTAVQISYITVICIDIVKIYVVIWLLFYNKVIGKSQYHFCSTTLIRFIYLFKILIIIIIGYRKYC